jgi:hypothetical protein
MGLKEEEIGSRQRNVMPAIEVQADDRHAAGIAGGWAAGLVISARCRSRRISDTSRPCRFS